jgi:integrase
VRLFVAELRGRGWADSYIRRILGTGLAAMNFAYEAGELASAPRIRPGKLGLGQGTPRQRILEVEELARFYDAIEERELARYFVLLIATGSRPGAALGLTRSRVDLVRDRVDFQDRDTAPTAKRQPILPIVPGLRPWLAASAEVAGDFVVGRRDKALKLLWRAARTRAGLDADVVPYAVRHTVATWLAEQDVPDPQIDAWLGHAKASTAGTWYIRRRVYHAEYLSKAAAAIEALLARIAAQSERARPASLTLSPEDFSGVRASGVQPPSHLRGRNLVNSFGAGEGIRTLDPNLGKVVLYP